MHGQEQRLAERSAPAMVRVVLLMRQEQAARKRRRKS
jgi:hypothetical protein